MDRETAGRSRNNKPRESRHWEWLKPRDGEMEDSIVFKIGYQEQKDKAGLESRFPAKLK